MKVAIMGAGLSGLACAITLEKFGVSPVIYEKRSCVGDRFVNGEALLSILSKPMGDSIRYLSENHQIYLKPLANVNQFAIHSKHENAIVNGHLGFINSRGRHEYSFEKQLAEQVHSEINFHSEHSYEELVKNHSHVILATGDATYTKKIQPFKTSLTVSLIGATVEGNFNRFTPHAWLDYDIADKGYGFLLPYSEREATIVIAFPNYSETEHVEKKATWELFFTRVCSTLNQSLRITDTFNIENYLIGHCRYPRIGNTFFIGNCFGSMMPFLGFGQFESILTGIYAAHDLCSKGKYENLLLPLQKNFQQSLTLRRAVEKLTNPSIDLIVKGLNSHIGNKLFNSHNPLKLASILLKPFV